MSLVLFLGTLLYLNYVIIITHRQREIGNHGLVENTGKILFLKRPECPEPGRTQELVSLQPFPRHFGSTCV